MAHPDITDEIVGILRYDEQLHWMAGSTEFAGRAVALSLYQDENGAFDAALSRARLVIPHLSRYAAAAADYAAAELLELKNDEWADESEGGESAKPLTAAEFKARMKLESLVFDAEGNVTFYHDDGDLFFGHCIEIMMNTADEFYHADIPG